MRVKLAGERSIIQAIGSSVAIRTLLRRRVTEADLRKPGAYAMIAWGISELIRDARPKTGLTTTDLARQIGIDPSSMSRLEEAKANVSIDMLGKVCRALRIGMTEPMESGSWIYERQKHCWSGRRGKWAKAFCARCSFSASQGNASLQGEHTKRTTGRGNEVGQLSIAQNVLRRDGRGRFGVIANADHMGVPHDSAQHQRNVQSRQVGLQRSAFGG